LKTTRLYFTKKCGPDRAADFVPSKKLSGSFMCDKP
jgi:hypothetical protein